MKNKTNKTNEINKMYNDFLVYEDKTEDEHNEEETDLDSYNKKASKEEIVVEDENNNYEEYEDSEYEEEGSGLTKLDIGIIVSSIFSVIFFALIIFFIKEDFSFVTEIVYGILFLGFGVSVITFAALIWEVNNNKDSSDEEYEETGSEECTYIEETIDDELIEEIKDEIREEIIEELKQKQLSKRTRCAHCGSMYKEILDECPNCGSARIDEDKNDEL